MNPHTIFEISCWLSLASVADQVVPSAFCVAAIIVNSQWNLFGFRKTVFKIKFRYRKRVKATPKRKEISLTVVKMLHIQTSCYSVRRMHWHSKWLRTCSVLDCTKVIEHWIRKIVYRINLKEKEVELQNKCIYSMIWLKSNSLRLKWIKFKCNRTVTKNLTSIRLI